MARNRLNQRGDTIVEVMLALAILGAVIGSAYVVTNRNTVTNRDSQERVQAIKVAESQIERLRAVALTEPSVFTQTNFCLGADNTINGSGSAACTMNANGTAPAAGELGYRVSITRTGTNNGYISLGPANPNVGTRYNVAVQWDGSTNIPSGQAELNYVYEVYR